MTYVELACTFLGIWKPGQKCDKYLVAYANSPVWKCEAGHEFPKPKGRWRGEIHHEHDIPCPTLTDALAMQVLRELTAQNRHWTLERSNHGIVLDIDGTNSCGGTGCEDMAQAIIEGIARDLLYVMNGVSE